LADSFDTANIADVINKYAPETITITPAATITHGDTSSTLTDKSTAKTTTND
jgi:hypothetical protein